MKLNIFRTILALLLFFTAISARAESSVWVISTPKSNVYLAGSCHVLRASDHPLPVEFHKAYANSGNIIFEAPPGEMEKPQYLQKLLQAAAYSDGTTLKQHLSPAVYAKAESFCKKRNYPFHQYQLFRPWMLAMMLTMKEMERIGIEPSNGIDSFFSKKAARDGKTIGGLETVDQQIAFLAKMDASMGNEQILETVDELNQLESKILPLINAWKTGDEAKIEDFSVKELRDYPAIYQALLIDRNKKWVRDIEGYINASGNTMLIVGVAHLAGKDSVVDLLHKRGYKVAKLHN